MEYVPDSQRGCAFTPARGKITTSFDLLAAVLGEPTEGDCWQVTTEWKLLGPGGCNISVHDWRATSLFDPKLPSVADFRLLGHHEWTIGGDHRLDVEGFRAWLTSKIVEAIHAKRCEEKILNEEG